MRHSTASLAAFVIGLALLPAASPTHAAVAPQDRPFPARIELPDGFQPEGITIGPGPTAWFGSLADGDIYEVSLRTGKGSIISQGPGTPSVGLKSDRHGRLYVSGGPSGTARIVDIDTGAAVSRVLTTGESFINDVVLTKSAAWFTNSAQAELYRVDRRPDGGPGTAVTTLQLGGEWDQVNGFNANGISTTPTGRALLVINSTTGLLYRVDPATGDATEVDLGGADLTAGDGMLRHGRTLYVVRNSENEIAVLRLSRTGGSARLVRTIGADDLSPSTSFDTPTTVAKFGANLYLPNARFSIANPKPSDEYWVTKVRARAGS